VVKNTKVEQKEKLDANFLSPLASAETLSWRGRPRVQQMVQDGSGPVRKSESLNKINQQALPRYDVNPVPEYPGVARLRGYEGTVKLEVLVLADGRVGAIKLISSSGHRSLDHAARKAVQFWQFQPATSFGKAIESRIVVPINFVLDDK